MQKWLLVSSSPLRSCVLAACAMFLAPYAASASPIRISVEFWDNGAYFDATSFNGYDTISLGHVTLSGTGFEYSRELHGTMEIVTGPLLDYEFFPGDGGAVDDVSRYVYGPGEIRLMTEWDLLGGGHGYGAFVAPIPLFSFDVTEFPIKADVWANAESLLGPGLFDASLAKYLGTARRTTGGSFHLVADVYGDIGPPESWSRSAAFSGSRLTIDATVPEPSTLSLLGIGGLCVLYHRRHFRIPYR